MTITCTIISIVKIYRLRTTYHLGDRWARINYALRRIEAGEDIALYLPTPLDFEIVACLDLGDLKPTILSKKPLPSEECRATIDAISRGTAAYKCNYFPCKLGYSPHGSIVGYSFDANWKVEDKIPPRLDEEFATLQSALPNYRYVPIGRPYQNSVNEVITSLSRLRLLISVDNGIAHIGRSVGVPMMLVEHRLPITRGFPVEACTYVLTNVDTLKATALSLLSDLQPHDCNAPHQHTR